MSKLIQITKEEAQQIAKAIGKNPQYVMMVISAANRKAKKPVCGIPLALKIEEASGGKIPATKLRPDLKDIAKRVLRGL